MDGMYDVLISKNAVIAILETAKIGERAKKIYKINEIIERIYELPSVQRIFHDGVILLVNDAEEFVKKFGKGEAK